MCRVRLNNYRAAAAKAEAVSPPATENAIGNYLRQTLLRGQAAPSFCGYPNGAKAGGPDSSINHCLNPRTFSSTSANIF